MESLLGRHWHHLAAEEVLYLLDTDGTRGLDRFEVERRQRHFGPNLISARKARGPVLRFLLQLHQPLVYILIISGVVTAVLKGPVDAAVILGVVLINAVVGFLQEAKAEEAIEALSHDCVLHLKGNALSIGCQACQGLFDTGDRLNCRCDQ